MLMLPRSGQVAIAGRGDLDDELAHPAAGQAEPLGHGPLAQWLPGRDRRRIGARTACSTRLARLALLPLMAARGLRARLTCCMAISTAPMNATVGQAEISAPSSSYLAP